MIVRTARPGTERGLRRRGARLFAALVLLGTGAGFVSAQVPPEQTELAAIKVFLDGRNLQWDYIRSEIPYLNYVRERQDADVHILITTQPTGSGGSDYCMAFIGLNEFADLNFTLHYYTDRTDVGHDVRRGIVRTLQKGLVPFVARTPLTDKFDVVYDPRTPVRAPEMRDRWDYWVFALSASGSTSGVKTRTSGSFSGNLSANRVTKDWKIRMGANMAVDSAKYYLDEGDVVSTNERESFSGLVIRSLTDHWSAGFWLSFSAASYNNIKFSYSPSVAAEYSFFPYAESTRRQLYFQYRLSYNHYLYMETTIYRQDPREPLPPESGPDPRADPALGLGLRFDQRIPLPRRHQDQPARPQRIAVLPPLSRIVLLGLGKLQRHPRPDLAPHGRGEPGGDPAPAQGPGDDVFLRVQRRVQLHLRIEIQQRGQSALRVTLRDLPTLTGNPSPVRTVPEARDPSPLC